jgi:signal transduction histidine kinase
VEQARSDEGWFVAEQALENERRLRFLTDNVPNVVLYQLLIEPSGKRRFVYISAGVEELHGFSAEQVLADASLIYDQINEQDRPRLLEAEERSRRDGSLFEVEIRSASKHGERWMLLRSAPREVAGGTLWDGVEIDVTAAKQQAAERQRLEDSLRQAQKMESVGRLAGGVAHDFNNMLTAIMGNISMARLELPDHSALAELLDEATNAARAAENLTRQLLAFSRKQVLVPQLLSLNDVATRTKKMLERLLGADVALRTELASALLPVNADPGQIEQMLVNLAVNARDAMPGGGVLTLGTQNQRLDGASAHRLELAPGDYVVLWVRDDGTGMSPEVQARLFEPFFTTKGVGKGTGLGLAMVYGGVKQNGGSIEVRSELGRGSEFRLYFPAGRPLSESSGPAPRPHLPRGKETILVVEDEPLVRALARGILERQGYQVVACASGAEALEALSRLGEQELDLLLTDLVMPGMNGHELAEAVLARRPSVRVLFTSGYSEDAAFERSVAAERAQFLAKPYSVHDLSRRVRELLDLPS